MARPFCIRRARTRPQPLINCKTLLSCLQPPHIHHFKPEGPKMRRFLSSLAVASTALLVSTSPALVSADAGAAAAAATAGIKGTLKSLDYRYFVAGGVCAATSHGITCPIDVVKTKIQAQPEVYDKGMLSATLSIIKDDGPTVLLGGLGSTVVGYGIEGAMKFGVYEVCKPIMTKLIKGSKGAAYIAASVFAGAVASILLCPMESTRIRQVTDPEYADKGLMTAFPQLVKEEGFGPMFSGIWAMLSKQVPYTMAKQVSFDIVAGLLYAFLTKKEGVTADDLKWIVSVSAAFIASLFACIFSQPGDMILTETFKGSSGKGFFGIVKDINDKGGVPAFFTGTGARIVHVGMIITSQLVIYDIVKQAGLGSSRYWKALNAIFAAEKI